MSEALLLPHPCRLRRPSCAAGGHWPGPALPWWPRAAGAEHGQREAPGWHSARSGGAGSLPRLAGSHGPHACPLWVEMTGAVLPCEGLFLFKKGGIPARFEWLWGCHSCQQAQPAGSLLVLDALQQKLTLWPLLHSMGRVV